MNSKLADWESDAAPRRAGVSSFGIGGTNAHCVVEEAPETEAPAESRAWQLLLLSGRTKGALEAQSQRLGKYLREHPAVNLADVAHVYQEGRKAFAHRRMLLLAGGTTAAEAAAALGREGASNNGDARERAVVFLFSGQGTQYAGMARELYEHKRGFREHMDECCELLRQHVSFDLKALLYPTEVGRAEANAALTRTEVTQPALFATEYALARLWMHWGIVPQAMMGHSIGEFVAACLAGVMSLADACGLVALRGALMGSMPVGAMVGTPLSEAEARSLLERKLSLAAVNGPAACVLSGLAEGVEQVERQLATRGLSCRRLATSHAFHSTMMEPAVGSFVERVRGVALRAPQTPYISNVTGTWVTAEDATSAEYWGRHLRQTVRFGDGVRTLLQDPDSVFLEVGPGNALGTLVKLDKAAAERTVLASLRAPQDPQADTALLLATLGKLWLAGATPDWRAFSGDERRRRLSLPTYPFEGQRYWIGTPDKQGSNAQRRPVADWFYTPVWTAAELAEAGEERPAAQHWLLLGEASPLRKELARLLKLRGHQVTLADRVADVEFEGVGQIVRPLAL